MKLYGIEASFAPDGGAALSRESIDDLLDTLHDAFVSNENVYSADLIADGVSEVSLLVGIQVAADEGTAEALGYAASAFEAAFASAGVPFDTLAHVQRAPAMELSLC